SITTGTQSTAPKGGPQGVSDHVLFKRVTVQTLICLVLWNMVLIALNWGYIARADWYFKKELPYDWLQTALSAGALACLASGSWWFYLLVKRPETPRSFQDYWRVWRTYDPRLLPAWKLLGIGLGCWSATLAYALLRYGFEENIPFLLIVQGGYSLTPFVLMVVLWLVIRRRAWWKRRS